MGSLKEIVVTLDSSHLPIQLLVVTGINRRLKRKLQALESDLNLSLKVLGYIKQIDELMEISDLLISKPGGLTTAEALVKKLPLGIFDSLAGQERRNQQLLSEKGVTFELKGKEDLIDLIQRFLNNSLDLTQWRQGVNGLARPQATQEIVEKLVSLTKQRKNDSRISRSTH
jgi:processive 1,2-diacylglycerol beta-glucosyltransferase